MRYDVSKFGELAISFLKLRHQLGLRQLGLLACGDIIHGHNHVSFSFQHQGIGVDLKPEMHFASIDRNNCFRFNIMHRLSGTQHRLECAAQTA